MVIAYRFSLNALSNNLLTGGTKITKGNNFVYPQSAPRICYSTSFFPAETEYNVELKIHLPEGVSDSIRDEIRKLASEKASNPLSKGNVINEWGFGEDNSKEIFYRIEDVSNVGCVVMFKPQCDTVYVTRYK